MYEGQITVLLGHNGAGKTTTMSMLTGMINPTSGTAKVNGYDIRTDMEEVRNSLGLCPQHNIIFDELTVSEHLYFFSKLKGLSKDEIKAEIDKYRNSKSSTLSGGMKRKLCVGMALCGNSKVVMLDEPTAGMDPSARRALWDLLQCQKEGRTLLLTTHFMDEADLLGDRIAIMAGGELKCCGSSFFLKKKYGAGYSLIMDKSKNCDAGQVTQLLRKHVPNIEIHSNIGSELTYLLVENQSSLFEPMLRDLEDQCERLGVRSYGISLTTLEEVFMKVGADHGQEEAYPDLLTQNGHRNENDHQVNGEIKVNIGLGPSFTRGFDLLKNQFFAMFLKKILSTARAWILLLIQIFMPVIFLIIAVVVTRNNQRTGDLPAMSLNLDRFDHPVTLVEQVTDNKYAEIYKNVLRDFSYHTEDEENITERMISLINQLLSGQTMGFQLAFNIAFSMAFVSSFYVLFIVRENISKSKHLQFVSGVKVYIFWITALLCDMVTYLVTILALIITLVCFQEDGFSTADDIGRLFLILIYFGWAFLPMLYIAGYMFDVPSTGYTRMTLVSIFTGVGAFLVVQVLSADGLNLEYVGNGLHWAFLVVPHYSLATGISETFKLYSFNRICSQCTNGICFNASDQFESICKGVDERYYKWEAPGIVIEYKVFSQMIYFIKQKWFPKHPVDVENEDEDVAEEKQKIRNASNDDISNKYTLALRDLTKYYKNHLAVNSLCLGVQKYECFGLLGVNGAGKTTTFKMMTGDVRISYGDGWVNGSSIKYDLKNVQKIIGYCPQFDALLDDMTARETIVMFSLLRGIRYGDCSLVAEHLAREFDFTAHLDKKVKQLSGGNKRKLSTSISLIGDPPVIYLDEPTTENETEGVVEDESDIEYMTLEDLVKEGMDPATKRYLWNALCKLRDNGKCIILTSHSMEEAEALCTRLAIMVNGIFKCLGSTQHLKHKFAEGYTVTIKIKKHLETGTEAIEQFMQQNFP
ncbi:hypothetical protein NQ314_011088, partial [Rhamnusium bicolor]